MTEDIVFEEGSDNVFADLGFPNPDEQRAKADLAIAIQDRIKALGLTQTQAAKLIGVAQPNLSAIVRGRLREVSLERLAAYLRALGVNIELRLTVAEPQTQGSLVVKAG